MNATDVKYSTVFHRPTPNFSPSSSAVVVSPMVHVLHPPGMGQKRHKGAHHASSHAEQPHARQQIEKGHEQQPQQQQPQQQPEQQTSRLCVKNIPKYLTEQRLKDHFAAKGQVTDVKVLKTR